MAKWSIRNAAIWGAVLGIAYVAATALYKGETRQVAEWVGLLAGGGIGGVILFTIVAAVRNSLVRA